MKLTIPFRYFETVIPPRCRTPREEEHLSEIAVDIPEVTSEQALIAIKGKKSEYRWYNGKLWERFTVSISRRRNAKITAKSFKPDYIWGKCEGGYPLASAQEAILKNTQEFLFIDGCAYTAAAEPVYVVQTFGLGNNHGGTSIVEETINSINRVDSTMIFSLLEAADALQMATLVAQNRGDTLSIPRLKKDAKLFKVLIPGAIKFSGKALREKSLLAEIEYLDQQIHKLQTQQAEARKRLEQVRAGVIFLA